MSAIGYKEEAMALKVNGADRRFVVRTPDSLCADPALLINLGTDIYWTLDQHPQRFPSDVFVAAGHRVASLDLPCHGTWPSKLGGEQGLRGMAAAMSAGEDLLVELGQVAKAAIDACVERKLARAGHVVTCGTSRGGLGALHILAADERVTAVAMLAPVTYLPSLTEFREVEKSPIVQSSSAAALVDKVKGRAVCVTINTNDTRVSTERSMEFYSLLRAAYPTSRLGIWTHRADGHGMPDPGYHYGAAFLLTLCAETSR